MSKFCLGSCVGEAGPPTELQRKNKPLNFQTRPHPTKAEKRLPFECVALLLQGGGALGAYQGGVYEALAEANIHPDWIAGISIGAINAAIIAGNPPNSRVDRLREFWTQGDVGAPWDWSSNPFRGPGAKRPPAICSTR